MAIYAEYTTLTDFRSTYLGSSGTAEDTNILAKIRETSRDIDKAANKRFHPRIETRYYDAPNSRSLFFDAPLLELTTLESPSGTTVTSTDYFLAPYNVYPKTEVRLIMSNTTGWQLSTTTDSEKSVVVTGVFGFHNDYSEAWLDINATLAAAISSTSATTFTCTTGKVRAGDLLKIDSEYIYAVSVSTAASDTVTCIRGVNGSTAATHLISTALYRWQFHEIQELCKDAVQAKLLLKNNPAGETIRIGEYVFSTPKDVQAFLVKRLQNLGFGADML